MNADHCIGPARHCLMTARTGKQNSWGRFCANGYSVGDYTTSQDRYPEDNRSETSLLMSVLSSFVIFDFAARYNV